QRRNGARDEERCPGVAPRASTRPPRWGSTRPPAPKGRHARARGETPGIAHPSLTAAPFLIARGAPGGIMELPTPKIRRPGPGCGRGPFPPTCSNPRETMRLPPTPTPRLLALVLAILALTAATTRGRSPADHAGGAGQDNLPPVIRSAASGPWSAPATWQGG